MPKAEFDKQGKYFWHLVKSAGWTEERVMKLLLKRWNATHWNALQPDQKRAAINMMTSYAKKADQNRSKLIRQSIMALVSRNGYDLAWLHEQMLLWGYGESMRELSFTRVMQLRRNVMGCFNGKKIEEANKPKRRRYDIY